MVSQRQAPPNSWNLLCQSVYRVIKLKVLSKKDYPGLSSWVPNTTTCILVGGKQREISHTHTHGSPYEDGAHTDRLEVACLVTGLM